MKTLLTLLLLPLLSFAQYDFNKEQINNLYRITKDYEWYKENYPVALKANDSLYLLVVQQDKLLQGYIQSNKYADEQLSILYEQKEKLAVQVESLKNKGWSFWEWALFIGSNILTAYVTHQIIK